MEMQTYTSDWVEAGRHAREKAAATVHECGTQMVVGYSNLGVPMACCPTCSPTVAANAKRSIGEAWGYREAGA